MSKGALTRARFVDTTAQLLRENGFHGTGVLEVVEHSGAPRGSLYYHFPGGKEELAAEAVEKVRADLVAWIDRTNLRQFFHQYARWIEKLDFGGRCPVQAVASESAHSERLRGAATDAFDAMEAAFVRKLEAAGHSPGRARVLASLLVCQFEGAIVMSQARRSAQPMRDAYDQLEPLLTP